MYFIIKAVNPQGRPYSCSVLTAELAETALRALEKANYTSVSYDRDAYVLHDTADTLVNDILIFSNY